MVELKIEEMMHHALAPYKSHFKPIRMSVAHILGAFTERNMIIGLAGSGLLTVTTWVNEMAMPILTAMGILLGAGMAAFGMVEKWKSIQKLNLEIRQKRHEVEKEEEEDHLGI